MAHFIMTPAREVRLMKLFAVDHEGLISLTKDLNLVIMYCDDIKEAQKKIDALDTDDNDRRTKLENTIEALNAQVDEMSIGIAERVYHPETDTWLYEQPIWERFVEEKIAPHFVYSHEEYLDAFERCIGAKNTLEESNFGLFLTLAGLPESD